MARVSHAAWPQLKMPAHKTARMAQKQQFSASGGALLGAMTFAAEKTFTVEGIGIPDTRLWQAPYPGHAP
jgi:hypothetical protein